MELRDDGVGRRWSREKSKNQSVGLSVATHQAFIHNPGIKIITAEKSLSN